MISNLERYKKDLDTSINQGEKLFNAIQRECFPKEFDRIVKKTIGDKAEEITRDIPSFIDSYQSWYSEAKTLVKQLLPDRLADFVSYYEKPKSRKEISYESYTIEDYLQNLRVTHGYNKETIVGPDAAIPKFRQQLAILISVKKRFESSLFDIRQLVQADLFDSELDAAEELKKHKFLRAAGALAGVVLEHHLNQVCDNHKIKLSKKNTAIADMNDALKEAEVLDIAQWRFIQRLGDLRNLCDHDKKVEPTLEQVDDLITGTMKTTKTLF